MKLPLIAVIMTPHWARIVDADNHTVCEVYGNSAEADARALVNAVNERAALLKLRLNIEHILTRVEADEKITEAQIESLRWNLSETR